jgi:hypothetical protein
VDVVKTLRILALVAALAAPMTWAWAAGAFEPAPPTVAAPNADAGVDGADLETILASPEGNRESRYKCPDGPSECASAGDCQWLVCPPGREPACNQVCGIGQCVCQLVWW